MQIDAITGECFNAALQLRRLDAEHAPSPDLLQNQLVGVIDTMSQNALRSGLHKNVVQDIAYAIVALMDEVALGRPGPVRDYWMGNLLQMRYFNENTAGDGFFQRLERLQQQASDPGGRAALQVYFLALMFGFAGRFRVRGGEAELTRIRNGLRDQLAPQRNVDLAPSVAPPKRRSGQLRRTFPLIAFSLATLVAAIGFYGFLQYSAEDRGTELEDRIRNTESDARKRVGRSDGLLIDEQPKEPG